MRLRWRSGAAADPPPAKKTKHAAASGPRNRRIGFAMKIAIGKTAGQGEERTMAPGRAGAMAANNRGATGRGVLWLQQDGENSI